MKIPGALTPRKSQPNHYERKRPMNDIAIRHDSQATMNSLEISALVESRHDKVKQSIVRLAERGVIAQPPLGEVQETKGNRRRYTTSVFIFEGEKGRRDSIVVVAQLSPEFTARLVDRWQELEAKQADNLQRLSSRNKARLEAPFLSAAIKHSKEDEGKQAMPYHFSNESDMINRIVLGMTSKKYRVEHGVAANDAIRDHLTTVQIQAIEHLQRSDQGLVESGMDFQERKKVLTRIFLTRYGNAMNEEIMRLEA